MLRVKFEEITYRGKRYYKAIVINKKRVIKNIELPLISGKMNRKKSDLICSLARNRLGIS